MPEAFAIDSEPLECGNCGETQALLRCSRCHAAYFCSSKCQRAYWPFHKAVCGRNEFADAVEDSEPKFASWMRKHRKLAVLKDDEVDRLERAGAACAGMDRAEVMDSMYNRLIPKPREPCYSAEERAAMRLAAQEDQKQAFAMPSQQIAWSQIHPPLDLGLDCGTYKWTQNQTEVDVFVPIPDNVRRQEVCVKLTPTSLHIAVAGRVIVNGRLCHEIKQEESLWLLENRILHLVMLKRNRRGNYANGCTNADTFWTSILQNAPEQEKLQLAWPPAKYYHLLLGSADNTQPPQPPAK